VAVTLVNRLDIEKLHRIEKLIGYEVPKATLPDFIAEKHNKISDHRPSETKTEKSRFKRGFYRKGKRQGAKDK
jgi:hypothetical protein